MRTNSPRSFQEAIARISTPVADVAGDLRDKHGVDLWQLATLYDQTIDEAFDVVLESHTDHGHRIADPCPHIQRKLYTMAGLGVLATSVQDNSTYNSGLLYNARKITDLVVSKQRDYGPKNITRRGMVGVITRATDKSARALHLLQSGNVPENETLRDTFMDWAGYGFVGLLFERGEFLLPLEEN